MCVCVCVCFVAAEPYRHGDIAKFVSEHTYDTLYMSSICRAGKYKCTERESEGWRERGREGAREEAGRDREPHARTHVNTLARTHTHTHSTHSERERH